MLTKELISFKNLYNVYSRAILSKVINNLISRFNLTSRVILIITNNVSNNIIIIIIEINSYLKEVLANSRFLDGTI